MMRFGSGGSRGVIVCHIIFPRYTTYTRVCKKKSDNTEYKECCSLSLYSIG